MPEIRQLPQSVINKIAAGEVIERPASILKELLENALDAGSTRIDVSLEQGGSDLVRVVDNGCGIAAEQLPLAIAAHATSKLRSADDLFRVATLGFRGEALASMAEVSRFLLRSRPHDQDAGAQIEVNAGELSPVAPAACSVGTTIEVRQIFCNTPVRRKFLKTTQTELGHLVEAFTRIALAFPQVHFTLRHNQRQLYDLPPADPWSERVAALLGRDLADRLIWIDSQDGEVGLSGYVAHPSVSRNHNRMQYVFLNGRFIRDRALQHALTEAYRGLLTVGRYPVCCLRLNMPPEMVDVNVHPTKLEVRFQDASRHYSLMLGTLRRLFLSTDLTHELHTTRAHASATAAASGTAGGETQSAASSQDALDARAAQAREELVSWANGQINAFGPASASADRHAAATAEPAALTGVETLGPPLASTYRATPQGMPPRQLELHAVPLREERRIDRLPGAASLLRTAEGAGPGAFTATDPSLATGAPSPVAVGIVAGCEGTLAAPAGSAPAAESDPAAHLASSAALMQAAASAPPQTALQVANRYLITTEDESVVIIDQHALHERVLYEQFRERILAGKLESQRLLVPEPVDLTCEEAAAVLEASEVLAQLGLSVEPFGQSTVLVTSYPAMLRHAVPGEMVRDLAAKLLSGGKMVDRRDLLDEMLHSLACKAAIKSGDKLSPDEIHALLELRHLAQDAHHCPHGRPTSLVFTKEQLDRQFKRT